MPLHPAAPAAPDAPRAASVPDAAAPAFGLIVVGDEILSGKRADQHLPHFAALLAERGLALAWAEYVGDAPARITATLQRAFASGDVVVCTGGIGATPDDHTRQSAAAALGLPLAMHPEARRLIDARMQRLAREKGQPFDPASAEHLQRLHMALLPQGARIVPNPYNQIPGFALPGAGRGVIYFVPGFPVMAWPMMAWALDTDWAQHFQRHAWQERSVIIHGAMEARLTPAMQRVEAAHPHIKVFSLPSVDHPDYGPHIELGVKGPAQAVPAAYADLRAWLQPLALRYGPEITRP